MSDVFGTEKNKLKNTPQRWGAAIFGASIGASYWVLTELRRGLGVGDLKALEVFVILILPVFLSILIAAQIKDKVGSFLASLVLSGLFIPAGVFIVVFWMLITCGVSGC